MPLYCGQPGTSVLGGAVPPPQSRKSHSSPVPGTYPVYLVSIVVSLDVGRALYPHTSERCAGWRRDVGGCAAGQISASERKCGQSGREQEEGVRRHRLVLFESSR